MEINCCVYFTRTARERWYNAMAAVEGALEALDPDADQRTEASFLRELWAAACSERAQESCLSTEACRFCSYPGP
jgi:hypothetical protein